MQRFLRDGLTGAVFILLASCGGGADAPTSDLQQPQAAASVRTEKRLDLGEGTARASKVYIVRLAEPAAAAYDGSIRGFAATRPAKGTKFDSRHPDRQRRLLEGARRQGRGHHHRHHRFRDLARASELLRPQAAWPRS